MRNTSTKYTTESFEKKLKELFDHPIILPNDFEYKSIKQRIISKCALHGNLDLSLESLLKNGCGKCSREFRHKKEYEDKLPKILEIFKAVHGEKYDYSLIQVYEGIDSKVPIICKKHGLFHPTAYNHLQGYNCRKCSADVMVSKTQFCRQEEFVKRLKESGRYEKIEILEDYINHSTPIKYRCLKCYSVYKRTPNKLLQLNRNYCTHGVISSYVRQDKEYFEANMEALSNKRGTIYVIEVFDNEEKFIKVGNTSSDTEKRFSGDKLPYNYNILLEMEDTLYNCFMLEQYVLDLYKKDRYFPSKKFGGYTECLNHNMKEYVIAEIRFALFELHEPDWGEVDL